MRDLVVGLWSLAFGVVGVGTGAGGGAFKPVARERARRLRPLSVLGCRRVGDCVVWLLTSAACGANGQSERSLLL